MAKRTRRHGGLPCRHGALVHGYLVACHPSPRNLTGRIRLREFVYGPQGERSGLWFVVKPGIRFAGRWVFFVTRKDRLPELTSFLRRHRIEHEVLESRIGPVAPC